MTSLTQKGQITIPKEVRIALGLKQGDEVEFNVHDNKAMLIKKFKKLPFEKWSDYLGVSKTNRGYYQRYSKVKTISE